MNQAVAQFPRPILPNAPEASLPSTNPANSMTTRGRLFIFGLFFNSAPNLPILPLLDAKEAKATNQIWLTKLSIAMPLFR